jgi:hypothetical protein
MKTRKNKTRKGGHKVKYDYNENIRAGTNKPLIGKHVHENNCLACVLFSLGMISESTATYLQRKTQNGVRNQPMLDMINDTYGLGHTLKEYPDEESLKDYLHPGEATLGHYGGVVRGVAEWGHFFIIFHAMNGKVYAIDPQEYTVTLLHTYLSETEWDHFLVLTEPSNKVTTSKMITPEIIKKAMDKDTELYRSQLESLLQSID